MGDIKNHALCYDLIQYHIADFHMILVQMILIRFLLMGPHPHKHPTPPTDLSHQYFKNIPTE